MKPWRVISGAFFMSHATDATMSFVTDCQVVTDGIGGGNGGKEQCRP